jgi:O-antigen/teichoic acid export membrane protein
VVARDLRSPAGAPPARITGEEGLSASEARSADLTRLARGGALNLVGGVVNGIFGFVLVVVLTRGLHAARAGAFFEAVGILTIAGTTVALGADVGLVRMIARFRALGRTRELGGLLRVSLVPIGAAGVLAAVACFWLAAPLAHAFGRGTDQGFTAAYLRVLAPFIPILAVYTAAVAATRGFGTMRPSVAIDRFGTPVAQPVLVLVAIAAGSSIAGLGLAYGVPVVVGLVAALGWIARAVRRATAASTGTSAAPAVTGRGPFAEFWRFTAPRGVAGIFQVVAFWLNTLLLGAFASVRAAGVYTAATRYVMVGSLALIAVVNVVGPQISDLLTRAEPARARAVYQAGTCWLMLLTWPVYITMAFFAPVLLRVFGREFGSAATAMAILCGAMLLSTAAGPVDTVLLMAGRSGWNLANTAVALTLNVGLNVALIPRLGMTGAAIAWAASVAANNLLPLLEVWLLMRMEPFARGAGTAALLAVVCYGGASLGARAAIGTTVPALLLAGLIATAAYAPICWRLRGPLDLATLVRATRPRRERPVRSRGR